MTSVLMKIAKYEEFCNVTDVRVSVVKGQFVRLRFVRVSVAKMAVLN